MNHQNTIAGTIGGTCVAVIININSEDILRTIVLTGIGAIVSFSVSLFLKYCLKVWRRKR